MRTGSRCGRSSTSAVEITAPDGAVSYWSGTAASALAEARRRGPGHRVHVNGRLHWRQREEDALAALPRATGCNDRGRRVHLYLIDGVPLERAGAIAVLRGFTRERPTYTDVRTDP